MTLIIAAKNKKAIAVVSDLKTYSPRSEDAAYYSNREEINDFIKSGKMAVYYAKKILQVNGAKMFAAFSGTHLANYEIKDSMEQLYNTMHSLKENSQDYKTLKFALKSNLKNQVRAMIKEMELETGKKRTKHVYDLPSRIIVGNNNASEPILLETGKNSNGPLVENKLYTKIGYGNHFIGKNDFKQWYSENISLEEMCINLAQMLINAENKEKSNLKVDEQPILGGQDLAILTKSGFKYVSDLKHLPKYDNLLSKLSEMGFDFKEKPQTLSFKIYTGEK